jgi:hypothetical protein
MMPGEAIRRSEIDRRSKLKSADVKSTYTGPERRSGNERRIWIDRISEIRSKMNYYATSQGKLTSMSD